MLKPDTVLFGSDTLEYRPSWCFIIEDLSLGHQEIDPNREMNSQVNNMMFYPKVTAHIDAITGDIYLCDAVKKSINVQKAG